MNGRDHMPEQTFVSPQLKEAFDFNEKFSFPGGEGTFERPIRSLHLQAKKVFVAGSVRACRHLGDSQIS